MCEDRLYTSESDVYRRQILTYKDGPRAVKCGDRLYTSESDVYIRQILTYKDNPRAVRVNYLLTLLTRLFFDRLLISLVAGWMDSHLLECLFDWLSGWLGWLFDLFTG